MAGGGGEPRVSVTTNQAQILQICEARIAEIEGQEG